MGGSTTIDRTVRRTVILDEAEKRQSAVNVALSGARRS